LGEVAQYISTSSTTTPTSNRVRTCLPTAGTGRNGTLPGTTAHPTVRQVVPHESLKPSLVRGESASSAPGRLVSETFEARWDRVGVPHIPVGCPHGWSGCWPSCRGIRV
jgi:hypothetical protein